MRVGRHRSTKLPSVVQGRNFENASTRVLLPMQAAYGVEVFKRVLPPHPNLGHQPSTIYTTSNQLCWIKEKNAIPRAKRFWMVKEH